MANAECHPKGASLNNIFYISTQIHRGKHRSFQLLTWFVIPECFSRYVKPELLSFFSNSTVLRQPSLLANIKSAPAAVFYRNAKSNPTWLAPRHKLIWIRNIFVPPCLRFNFIKSTLQILHLIYEFDYIQYGGGMVMVSSWHIFQPAKQAVINVGGHHLQIIELTQVSSRFRFHGQNAGIGRGSSPINADRSGEFKGSMFWKNSPNGVTIRFHHGTCRRFDEFYGTPGG